jgi:hypothetical protein
MTNSGIYIRVRAEDLLLEDMPEGERQLWLDDLEREALCRTIHYLCGTLRELQGETIDLSSRIVQAINYIEDICIAKNEDGTKREIASIGDLEVLEDILYEDGVKI